MQNVPAAEQMCQQKRANVLAAVCKYTNSRANILAAAEGKCASSIENVLAAAEQMYQQQSKYTSSSSRRANVLAAEWGYFQELRVLRAGAKYASARMSHQVCLVFTI